MCYYIYINKELNLSNYWLYTIKGNGIFMGIFAKIKEFDSIITETESDEDVLSELKKNNVHFI